MNNIYQTRAAAFELASSKYEAEKTVYKSYSPIYIASTSNVKSTIDLYKDYESVLSVGATGAHAYEAMLNGARKIDLFDVNELQRLYFEYMKTAITFLDYETFIKHFTLKQQNFVFTKKDIKDLLSNELYDQLAYFLPEDVEMVFSPLYDFFDSTDLILSGLFRFEHIITLNYLKRNISFYNEEQYYKLQKILRNEKYELNYETLSLTDVPNHFDGKYDLIILDNILQYYKDIFGLETPYAVNMFIRKKLSNLLKEDGIIQVNYGFEVATDALKDKFNIPFNKEQLNATNIYIIQKEKKEGINIPLVEKWDDYSYTFVPGVERIRGRDSDNLVISYPKNSSKQKNKILTKS